MLSVNNATKQAWANYSQKSFRVYFPNLSLTVNNSKIYKESLEINETLCDDDALYFVGCIASQMKIKISDLQENVVGESVEVYMTAGTTTEIPLFKGKVESAEYDANKKFQKIIAYDSLYEISNADVSTWYEELALPMTMTNFRNSFFQHFNITQNSTTLCNDDLLVERTIDGEIKGSDIIRAICEINGVCGRIDRYNHFSYVVPASNNIQSLTASQYIQMQHEDFTCQEITKLQIRATNDDVGAVVGSGDNAYIVEGNFLCFGKNPTTLETIAQNLLNHLSGITYIPFKSEQPCNPIFETGDSVQFTTPWGDTITSFILSRTMKGIHAIHDVYETKGVEVYEKAVNTTNHDLIALKGKTNELTRDVEQTRSTITNVEASLRSEITQTAEGIEIQIEALQSQIDGEIQYYQGTETPTLSNAPAMDFCRNIPVNSTIQLGENGIQFEYTVDDYKLHLQDLYYDIDDVISYRFSKENETFLWKVIADGQTTAILQRLTTVEATASGLTTTVTEVTADLNDLSDRLTSDYSTTTTMRSEIQQSASGVLSTVSRTYATKTTTNSMQTQINQQANAITAKAEKNGASGDQSFAWNLDASGFYLASNGNSVMEVNGSGLIVKGNVQANSGNIGGWTIQPYSIDNGLPFTNQKNSKATGVGTYGSNWAFWAGNGRFTVDQNGNVYMASASIDGYATADRVTAEVAQLNSVIATKVTADQVKTIELDASKITTGTLSASRIDLNGVIGSFSGKILVMHECQTDLLVVLDGSTYRLATWQTKTINGTTIHYLGY